MRKINLKQALIFGIVLLSSCSQKECYCKEKIIEKYYSIEDFEKLHELKEEDEHSLVKTRSIIP